MISIIIPVFNVGKYVQKCLQSIVTQTYRDWEIILVDDGSVDDSVAQIISFFKNNPCNYLLLRQENKGVSVARNNGIAAAQGKYIQFVDADDWLSPDALQKMTDAIETENTDLVVGGVREIYESGSSDLIKPAYLQNNVSAMDVTNAIINGQEDGFVWRCLFKKEIIVRNNIIFLKDLPVFEDMLFLLEYLRCSRSAYFITDVHYNYWKNNASALARFNPKLIHLPLLFDKMQTLIPIQEPMIKKAFVNLKISYTTWIISSNISLVDFPTALPLIRAGQQCISWTDFRYISLNKLGKRKVLQAFLLKVSKYFFWKMARKS